MEITAVRFGNGCAEVYLLHSRLTLAAAPATRPQRIQNCTGLRAKWLQAQSNSHRQMPGRFVAKKRHFRAAHIGRPPPPLHLCCPTNGDDGRGKTMLIICVHSIIRINGVYAAVECVFGARLIISYIVRHSVVHMHACAQQYTHSALFHCRFPPFALRSLGRSHTGPQTIYRHSVVAATYAAKATKTPPTTTHSDTQSIRHMLASAQCYRQNCVLFLFLCSLLPVL